MQAIGDSFHINGGYLDHILQKFILLLQLKSLISLSFGVKVSNVMIEDACVNVENIYYCIIDPVSICVLMSSLTSLSLDVK